MVITKGSYHRSDSLTEHTGPGNIGVLFNKDAFAGVAIEHFLSESELVGASGEEAFKAFLDKNSIPYLYIGQGPVGVEKSETLLSDLGSRRPDFLVNLPNLGYLFVDVKSRRKLGFPADETNEFYSLSAEELDGLSRLHRSLLIAVWVAFFDRDAPNGPRFHLASIPAIDEFRRSVNEALGPKSPVAQRSMQVIRIPTELLTTADQQLSFRVGLQPFDDESIATYAKAYKGLHRHVTGTIFETIRQEPIPKTKAIDRVEARLEFCGRNEVRNHLEALIEAGEIEYEPRKPLKLVGE